MYVKLYWGVAFLAAFGIREAIGDAPECNVAAAFALVYVICFAYLYRPAFLWGEWDPPIKELISATRESKKGVTADKENSAKNDEINHLLSSEIGENDTSRGMLLKQPSERTGIRITRMHTLKLFVSLTVVVFHLMVEFGVLNEKWTTVVDIPELNGQVSRVLLAGFVICCVYMYQPSYLWGESYSVPKEITTSKCGTTPVENKGNRATAEKRAGGMGGRTSHEIKSTETKSQIIPVAKTERIHFLDNIKIFLTFLVVSFHVTGAFGGLGENWTLVVGLYETNGVNFKTVMKGFNMVNQSYFMSLFFFISGFFTPSSYERKGGELFVKDRARRLLIPSLVTMHLLFPLSTMLAQWSVSIEYMCPPFTVHTWFIFWLLLFEWAYITIRKDERRSNHPPTPTEFPNTTTRCCLGLLVCGLATYFIAIVANIEMLWSMPTMSPGSVFCDMLLFFAGTVAQGSGWISQKSTITEQIDLPLTTFRFIVFIEGFCVFFFNVASFSSTLLELLYFLVAGVFCIDMSIFMLQLFQQYASRRPPAFLSDAAFTVFLIHPFVIILCTSIFVHTYSRIYSKQLEFEARKGGIFCVSESQLSGPLNGEFHSFVGFLIVLVMTNAIVWPAAWFLRRLPILNKYL